jgi:lactate dehydrogenase-like 2-hydroxyacid dehydrogenase
LRSIEDVDAVITLLSDLVDDEFLEAAGPGLKIVATYAVGYDNIDLAAAAARGVVVSNTPGVDQAMADLAMALLPAASRRVEADRFVRSGVEWTWRPDLFTGLDLSAGATLGIIGLGNIGQAVARRAAAFDMRVVATPSRNAAGFADTQGIEHLPLRALLAVSDAITLHCPLTDATRHLIGADELELLGPGGVLVNTARGPIVDEAALVDTLRQGTIRAAGLDVFEHEPRPHPGLFSLENCVILPHIRSAGETTRERMGSLAIGNVDRVLSGAEPLTPVAGAR